MPDDRDEVLTDDSNEEWEDIEDEDTGGPQPGEPTSPNHDEIEKLSSQNSTLFMMLCSHPKFNKSAPDRSPKPLWFVADFVRRTCLEYIAPICPSQENGPWPKFDQEKYNDVLSRSFLIAGIILDEKKQFVCGGPFDFGPEVRDLARFMLGTPQPEELEMLQGMSPEQVDRMRKK